MTQQKVKDTFYDIERKKTLSNSKQYACFFNDPSNTMNIQMTVCGNSLEHENKYK